jgi:hypothetical protein
MHDTARLGMPRRDVDRGRGGLAILVELGVMEQRYHAVMEVVSGAPVTDVARRYGVSRQAMHGWPARDPARLAASLEEFVGHPAYGLDRLRDDLERFAFLPGGSDGESLFGRPVSHEQDDVVNEPIPHPVDHGDMLLGREPGHDDAAAVLLVDHVIPGHDPAGDVRP